MAKIRKVGVLGCGLMGAGIAEVSLVSGFDVVVREVSEELLDSGRGKIERSLAKAVERDKLDAKSRDAALARFSGTVEVDPLADCDLIIEAIVEKLDEKRRTLRAVDEVAKPRAILATNTSSLTVTQLAAATGRPERFVGLHFFNPVPVMGLVEVVRTLLVDESVVDTATRFRARSGQRADSLWR